MSPLSPCQRLSKRLRRVVLTARCTKADFTSMTRFRAVNPRAFDSARLVENVARVDAWWYGRSLASLREGEIWLGAVRVAFEMTRAGPFFVCPECGRRARQLYFVEPVSCRRCVKPPIDYGSRHGERRSAPGAARIARLRRQIGAEPFPFSLLPPRPPRAGARHDSIVSRIEARRLGLLQALSSLATTLSADFGHGRREARKAFCGRNGWESGRNRVVMTA